MEVEGGLNHHCRAMDHCQPHQDVTGWLNVELRAKLGGYCQMLMFAYMVGWWVWQDAYVIKRITDEKQIS